MRIGKREDLRKDCIKCTNKISVANLFNKPELQTQKHAEKR